MSTTSNDQIVYNLTEGPSFSASIGAGLPAEKEQEQDMEKLAQNIQEAFLNSARKERIFLTIYLMSGVKLSGRIKSFDKYSVILESNNQEQLIFKHAISTVVVSRPVHGGPVHTQSSAAAAAGGVPGQAMPAPVHDPGEA